MRNRKPPDVIPAGYNINESLFSVGGRLGRAARCRPVSARCPDSATSRVNTTALLATGDDEICPCLEVRKSRDDGNLGRARFLSCSRWCRETSHRIASCPFRSMWWGRPDCHSDCRSSAAAGPWGQSCPQSYDGPLTDDPSAQARPCRRARVQRLMLLSEVS